MTSETLAFYVYANLSSLREAVALDLQRLAQAHSVVGRVRVGFDGLSGTCGSSRRSNIESFASGINAMGPLIGREIDYKYGVISLEDTGPGSCFEGFTVKTCPEIVTLALPSSSACKADPLNCGEHVAAAAFHEAIVQGGEDGATVILDIRNEVESFIGRFSAPENVPVLLPPTRTFSELPAWIDAHEAELRDKRILMYCTGGIRCERASAYLQEKGAAFSDVRQLKGGIFRYLEAAKMNQLPSASLWRGRLFEFDEFPRPSSSEDVATVDSTCIKCGGAWSHYSWNRCCECGSLVLICDECQKSLEDPHHTLPAPPSSSCNSSNSASSMTPAGPSGGDSLMAGETTPSEGSCSSRFYPFLGRAASKSRGLYCPAGRGCKRTPPK